MRVTLLGTGTSTGVPVPTCGCEVCRSDDPRDRRLRTSAWLRWDGASVLVDTSTDLRRQALDNGIDRIDAVLYTHAHADHILGLDDLRLYNWRQGGPIPAYGSRRTLDALARTFWYVFTSRRGENTRPEVEPREADAPFELGGRTVVPVPADHGRLPILGWRVGRFAYLTDVKRIPADSLALLAGLDVLVLNALRDRPHPTHLTIDEAIATAGRIGARQTWFTHMSHEVSHAAVDARLPAGVDLAYDGLTFDVPEDP